MNPAIEYLAKTCVNIIKAQGLSQADAILCASKVVELVASGASPTQEPSRSQPEPPPPPSPSEPPRVIAKKGAECSCAQCKKVVYNRTGDILSTMKGEDFTNSFKSIGHKSKVTKFQNIEGNILVDCPLCGAESSVALIGSVISHQFSSDIVV